eukprot:Seg4395.1 transcript_id=Seg4395.1/GoldUCD/mRNA.D3Y31 product="Mitochondrial carrier protein Rim2" protein_id=Seg4395.1/GoldUCD/D3Y31
MSGDANVSTSRRHATHVQLIAGGIGGTAGVVATCPLDVVQTRLQSSTVKIRSTHQSSLASVGLNGSVNVNMSAARPFSGGILSYIRFIAKTEGITALYKGLAPNLIGVAPTRAIYFAIYSKTKNVLGMVGPLSTTSPIVHMLSAMTASFSTSTLTNPIWFVKTRLQLDFRSTGIRKKVPNLILEVYRKDGIRGFYRGLTASYAGASETMLYFVAYERAKEILAKFRNVTMEELDPFDHVIGAGISKFFASASVYPHEVARTRMRQQLHHPDGRDLYTGFFQTLKKVYREEGRPGLYGGMGAHLLRQIPNTVIMFVTYEATVKFLANI